MHWQLLPAAFTSERSGQVDWERRGVYLLQLARPLIYAEAGCLASWGYSLLDFRVGGIFQVSVGRPWLGTELAWWVSGFVAALVLGMGVAAGV